MSIGSGVFDPRWSKNGGVPLTRLVALTTVLHYRADCDRQTMNFTMMTMTMMMMMMILTVICVICVDLQYCLGWTPLLALWQTVKCGSRSAGFAGMD